ncbi:unnamed product [Ostreococcus tauri]|uniref:Unnamed product n=1 Tax=Ostreococcus tauri TaxID=70448 RepID=A0A090M6C2_OSTTA|nr:unnamed product [Ostreococcus tauri]CEF97669.1 unnamed product [Ostreococcus tauri]|eukprot:XP_022838819.1 unnamed product [Ostreococcus tauri]
MHDFDDTVRTSLNESDFNLTTRCPRVSPASRVRAVSPTARFPETRSAAQRARPDSRRVAREPSRALARELRFDASDEACVWSNDVDRSASRESTPARVEYSRRRAERFSDAALDGWSAPERYTATSDDENANPENVQRELMRMKRRGCDRAEKLLHSVSPVRESETRKRHKVFRELQSLHDSQKLDIVIHGDVIREARGSQAEGLIDRNVSMSIVKEQNCVRRCRPIL